MGKIMQRLIELEKRVLELENSKLPAHGGRTEFYAEWILSFFKKKDKVLISDIREAAKKAGYSWQMITRARRDLLNIDTEIGNGKQGWAWRLRK